MNNKFQKYPKFLTVLLSLLLLSNLSKGQTFIEQTGITLEGLASASIAWGDYDNNGTLDLLMTGDNYSTNYSWLYENNGNNTFTLHANPLTIGVKYSSIAWGDYNNDGYLDIILSGGTFYGIPITFIYKNNGNGTFSVLSGNNLTHVTNSSLAWGDYNNDGYLDILLTGETSNNISISEIYKNNGNGSFTKQTAINLTGVRNGSVAWGDYNNDSYPDILLTGSTGSVYVSKIYKNNGDETFTEQTGISLTGVSNSSAAWNDYNNDGYLDILLAGDTTYSTIVSKIYKNNGNGTFTEQTGINLTGVDECSVAWGDYNNDGNSDILISGRTNINSTSYAVSKVYKNNGNSTFSEQTGISLLNVFHSCVVWGDYNNDGNLDILLTGHDYIYRYSKIYKNSFSVINNSPSVPGNLQHDSINNKISWNKSTDDHTPSLAISYNMAIGTASNPNKIKSAHSDLNTGFRQIAAMGNEQLDTFAIINYSNCNFDSIYFATIQAVDNAYKGSAFSLPLQFRAPPFGNIQNNDTTINCGNDKQLDMNIINGNPSNLSYSWTPATGITNPNIKNPVVKPVQTTWYKVVATSQYGLSFTDSIKITVNPMTVNAGTDITKICGDSVIFNPATTYPGNSTHLTWSWNPSNGLDNTSTKNPKAKPNTTTQYFLNLISTEGCTAADTINLTINPITVNAGSDTTIIFGDSIVLSPTINYPGNPTNLSWNWLPSGILDNAFIKQPEAKPVSTTNFIVHVSSVEGCLATDSIKISIGYIIVNAGNDVSKICGDSIIFNPLVKCYGDTSNLTWTWSPATGLSSTTIRKPKAKPVVTTTYIVNVTSLFGYSATDTIIITVIPMTVNAGTDLITTCGNSFYFNPSTNYHGNTANLTWLWSPGYGLSNTTIKTPQVTPLITTNYILNLSSSDGCTSAKDTINVTVNPMTVNAGSDGYINCGNYLNLYPSTNYTGNVTHLSWSWSPSTGLSSSTIKIPSAKPVTTTDYIINLSSTEGCTASDTIKINVFPINLDAGNNSNLACGGFIILNPSNNYSGSQSGISYQWSPAYGLDNTNTKNPIAKPLTNTTYYLTINSTEGCQSSDSIKLTLIPLSINAYNLTKTCGDPITFGATVNSNSTTINYLWSPVNGLSNPGILNPIVNPNHTTTYTLNAVDGICNATKSVVVTVNKAIYYPDFTASSTLLNLPPFLVQFNNNTPNLSDFNYKWDFGDATILSSNNTNINHTYSYNGLYTVSLIATHKINACSDSVNKPAYIQCTGGPSNGIFESSAKSLKYDVYPNPFTNEINIESKGRYEKDAFEIFNEMGQSIYKGILIEKTIVQTNNFKSGIYLIKLIGETFEFKKIVKE